MIGETIILLFLFYPLLFGVSHALFPTKTRYDKIINFSIGSIVYFILIVLLHAVKINSYSDVSILSMSSTLKFAEVGSGIYIVPLFFIISLLSIYFEEGYSRFKVISLSLICFFLTFVFLSKTAITLYLFYELCLIVCLNISLSSSDKQTFDVNQQAIGSALILIPLIVFNNSDGSLYQIETATSLIRFPGMVTLLSFMLGLGVFLKSEINNFKPFNINSTYIDVLVPIVIISILPILMLSNDLVSGIMLESLYSRLSLLIIFILYNLKIIGVVVNIRFSQLEGAMPYVISLVCFGLCFLFGVEAAKNLTARLFPVIAVYILTVSFNFFGSHELNFQKHIFILLSLLPIPLSPIWSFLRSSSSIISLSVVEIIFLITFFVLYLRMVLYIFESFRNVHGRSKAYSAPVLLHISLGLLLFLMTKYGNFSFLDGVVK